MEKGKMNVKVSDKVALPESLADLLAATPFLGKQDFQRLEKAGEQLHQDPAWQAEYLKGIFTEKMLEAMEEGHVSQSDLADMWEKSRQYVSKLFREDKRVNFTIETMTEMASLLGRRIELHILKSSESSTVIKCVASTHRVIASPLTAWGEEQTAASVQRGTNVAALFGDYKSPSKSFSQYSPDDTRLVA